MKKLYYLFLLLPFSMLMSCNNDKDISPVDMTLTLQGVTQQNDEFYTVIGEDIAIDDFTVKSIDGRNTGVTNCMFYLNGVPLNPAPGLPTPSSIPTENLPAGEYSINITGNLLQVDSSIKVFTISYPLTLVETEEDLPAGAPELGTYSSTIRVSE